MSFNEYEKIKPEIRQLSLLNSVDIVRWAIAHKPEKINDFAKEMMLKLNQDYKI